MKSGNKFLQWLTLVLCVVMAAGVLTQTAGAAEPTGKCTNAANEGIEYFTPYGALAKDADKWRAELDVSVVRADDGTFAGTVVGMEVEVVNDSTRYQCTQVLPPKTPNTFTCNSMPANALINGIYFLYKPDPLMTVGTEIIFKVSQTLEPKEELYTTRAKVTLPPYPCARNFDTRDFIPSVSGDLVLYTDDCGGKKTKEQTVEFSEAKNPYAIVNILDTNTPTLLKGGLIKIEGTTVTKDSKNSRVFVDVDIVSKYNFNFDLELIFKDANKPANEIRVLYDHRWDTTKKLFIDTIDSDGYDLTPGTPPVFTGSTYTGIDGLKEADLPLTLTGGRITNVEAVEKDGWGKDAYPPDAKFDIFFWYENTEGTLGYQNSVFHFERYLNIQFSKNCDQTAAASAYYDPCQASRQMFTAYLPTSMKINNWDTDPNKRDYLCAGDTCGKDLVAYTTEYTTLKTRDIFFETRRCEEATCNWTSATSAYVYSISVSDGGGSDITVVNNGVWHDMGSYSRFNTRLYGTKERPYAINGIRLVVDRPGTYVVYPFSKYSERGQLAPSHYLFNNGGTNTTGLIYVTVNDKDQLSTCSTPANNGYFRANWNDCLDSGKTQLLTFEHIAGKEEAWIENRSAHDIYFPYVEEWSYLPQKLQIASLTYKATALASNGQPGRARCTPEGCLVPPYTRITINGGTFYLESAPKFDEYRVAYARRDTYNIAHLFFNVHVKECERRIPNTGISLRSPLRVNERLDAAAPVTSITRNSFQSPLNVNAKVNEATDYVFTGNALRIPAIGLGMETPLPIVHVYYEEGSEGMQWDLSTLGNYVGELEGGSYIPYGGNSVLTGHFWSGGVFKNLEHLNLEDEIIVYGNDGVKYVYKVVQKFIAQPAEVYEMFQQVGDRSLTLVTCENYNLVTDEYERRYIVRAVLESQDLYEEGIW